MLISSHQHRNLRGFIIASLITIIVISGLTWFFVNSSIEETLLGLAKDKNQLAATVISDVIQTSKITKSKKLPSSLNLNRYLKTLSVSEINIADELGKILYSTRAEGIGQSFISEKIHEKVLQGKSLSLNINNKEDVKLYDVPKNHTVSFAPIYKIESNKKKANKKNDVVAVVKVVKDNNVLIKEIINIKYLMLIGLVVGIIVLLFILFFTAKYSNNLVNKYAKQIVSQSRSDPVTGVLNRHHFFRFIRQMINKSLQQNGRSVLLLVDVDHFKELNAKYDHSFGDEALKILVQRLSRLLGPTDILARTGDDEFSILVEQSESNSSIRSFARKILDKVNEPIEIDANYIHLTCSIGISVLNQDAKDMEELIQHADSALYNAKDFGRNNFQLFSRGGGTRHIKFYEKQYSLNKALEENEFVLFIQPKVHGDTGAVVGGEVLLRWNNPDFGLIQPLEFLPALETSGLIHNVGKWVLEESCKICKKWQEQGFKDVPVSVNVSALQFKKESFVSMVSEILRETELDGKMLDLELTETCLMDNVEQSLEVLINLKKLGIGITIDDFGTGYSSLNYLKRFPIDVLKIDQSFVANINNRSENDNAAIVTAIMALSHSLHLNVVAEGIETADELAYLNALGCKIIQGFIFSEPLPVDEFDSLLKDNNILIQRLNDIRKQLA